MNIHIETDRFIIRDMEAFDAQGMFTLDSDTEVHRYLGNKPIKSLKKSEEIIDAIKKQYKDYGMGRWAVVDKKTNEFIGWAGFKYEQKLRKGQTYYDLGYRFIRKYWGKGIGTEIALACVSYGFEHMGFKEIFAAAHIDNIASNKILIKTGFKFIETFTFEEIPCNWYGLTKEEWR
jgi:ribosomal-protein-alanine N-acetyltransferase